MEALSVISCLCGPSTFRFLIFTIWLYCIGDVQSHKNILKTKASVPYKFELSDPPLGLFDPIEISPVSIPRNTFPVEPLPPMYPSFPRTYEPILTGKCPVNFSSISSIMDKTASDCSAPLAVLVGNVICCPQVKSLMHIFQGSYSSKSDMLVLQQAVADDCFSDIVSILASRGANNTISTLCSVKSSNLTGSSCPVKEAKSFENIVNTSKLLEACSTVDPLKECCKPVCQPAIVEAAVRISSSGASFLDSFGIPGATSEINTLNDCKGVVYAWLSRKLSPEAANTAFRLLSSCKTNQVCPLKFEEPSAVIKECRNTATRNPSCCTSLSTYIATLQRQMLITNKQAINCATLFGSMLQKEGIVTNIYDLCDVDLKDFSLQAYGQQGCLLRSLPADVVIDNVTGVSFTCDLSDNIAAPWPSSASISSMSLCAQDTSVPALPMPHESRTSGTYHSRVISLAMLLLLHCVHRMQMELELVDS